MVYISLFNDVNKKKSYVLLEKANFFGGFFGFKESEKAKI